MLRVTEELLLLIMDAESGGIKYSLVAHQRDLVIAGAVLTDLALESRIDTDPERLFLIDPKPVDDDLLDPTLLDIAGETETHDMAWWIVRTAKRGGAIRERALGRLIGYGILEREGQRPRVSVPVGRTGPPLSERRRRDHGGCPVPCDEDALQRGHPGPARRPHHRPCGGLRRVREHPLPRGAGRCAGAHRRHLPARPDGPHDQGEHTDDRTRRATGEGPFGPTRKYRKYRDGRSPAMHSGWRVTFANSLRDATASTVQSSASALSVIGSSLSSDPKRMSSWHGSRARTFGPTSRTANLVLPWGAIASC